jgi:hypothetical protein
MESPLQEIWGLLYKRSPANPLAMRAYGRSTREKFSMTLALLAASWRVSFRFAKKKVMIFRGRVLIVGIRGKLLKVN